MWVFVIGVGVRLGRDGNYGSYSGCGQISCCLCFLFDIVCFIVYVLCRLYLCKFSVFMVGFVREEEDEDDDEEEEGEEESEGVLCGIVCWDFVVCFCFFVQCCRVFFRVVK